MISGPRNSLSSERQQVLVHVSALSGTLEAVKTLRLYIYTRRANRDHRPSSSAFQPQLDPDVTCPQRPPKRFERQERDSGTTGSIQTWIRTLQPDPRQSVEFRSFFLIIRPRAHTRTQRRNVSSKDASRSPRFICLTDTHLGDVHCARRQDSARTDRTGHASIALFSDRRDPMRHARPFW